MPNIQYCVLPFFSSIALSLLNIFHHVGTQFWQWVETDKFCQLLVCHLYSQLSYTYLGYVCVYLLKIESRTLLFILVAKRKIHFSITFQLRILFNPCIYQLLTTT